MAAQATATPTGEPHASKRAHGNNGRHLNRIKSHDVVHPESRTFRSSAQCRNRIAQRQNVLNGDYIRADLNDAEKRVNNAAPRAGQDSKHHMKTRPHAACGGHEENPGMAARIVHRFTDIDFPR